MCSVWRETMFTFSHAMILAQEVLQDVLTMTRSRYVGEEDRFPDLSLLSGSSYKS